MYMLQFQTQIKIWSENEYTLHFGAKAEKLSLKLDAQVKIFRFIYFYFMWMSISLHICLYRTFVPGEDRCQ